MTPDHVAAHQAALIDDFLSREVYTECSCGWKGEPTISKTEALAEWAAHVHVTAGLAEGGDPS